MKIYELNIVPSQDLGILDVSEGLIHVDSEEYQYIKELNFDILGTPENSPPIKVGYIKGYLIKGYHDISDEFINYDGISQSLYDLWNELTEDNNIEGVERVEVSRDRFDSVLFENFDYYFLEIISIQEKFRNQGLGTLITNNLLPMIALKNRLDLTGIILKPYPLTEDLSYEEFKKQLNRLEKFYKKSGFKRIRIKNQISEHFIKYKCDFPKSCR